MLLLLFQKKPNYEKIIYPSDICNVCKKGEMVYVDCDGTAGWINVDDWSVS